MEDLQSALQSILSDPKQMEQIQAMAASLGLQPPGPGQGPPGGAPEASPGSEGAETRADGIPTPDGAGPSLGMLTRLGQMQGTEDRVFAALRPGMSPRGQQRIDRALRAAKLSRLAGTVLRRQEPDHV